MTGETTTDVHVMLGRTGRTTLQSGCVHTNRGVQYAVRRAEREV